MIEKNPFNLIFQLRCHHDWTEDANGFNYGRMMMMMMRSTSSWTIPANNWEYRTSFIQRKCTYKIVIVSLLYHRLIKLSFVFVAYYRITGVAIVELWFSQPMMSISYRWSILRSTFWMIASDSTARSRLNICISWTTIWVCRCVLRCCIGCIRCTCIIVI